MIRAPNALRHPRGPCSGAPLGRARHVELPLERAIDPRRLWQEHFDGQQQLRRPNRAVSPKFGGDIIPNRTSPTAVLLREAWRERTRIRKRTLANLSALSAAQIEAMRRILRGETLVSADAPREIERSWPHGPVAAVLGMLRKLGL